MIVWELILQLHAHLLHKRIDFRSTILHTNITDRTNKSGGINFGKDYSMIADKNVSRIIFAKITEIIGS